MQSELVERLRRKEQRFPVQGGGSIGIDRKGNRVSTSYVTDDGMRLANPDGPEAADRITALEAENARLREALTIAEESLDQLLDDMGDDGQCVCIDAKEEAVEALATVRAALQHNGDEG